jgi:hypothetical protein
MPTQEVKRKLAAILSADAKGYSRLMGKEEEAKAVAADLLRINPKFSLEYVAKTSPYKRQEDKDQLIQGLRKAGLK